jgi:hypothetical protein
MRNLALHFNLGELIEVCFQDGSNSHAKVVVRGKTGGPFRAAGSFQWTSAVKALSLLVVRTALSPSEALLRGDANSLAASLDYAISKQPLWLTEMFGCDQQGTSLARRLILRTNPERKRPGPVTLGINQLYLNPSSISVFVNGKLATGEQLATLCRQLEELDGVELLQASAA